MATPSDYDCDVLVVGAGPVGLAMAGELGWRQTHCRVIDKAEGPSTLSKAVVIMPRTLEEFEVRGMAEACLKDGHIINSIGIHAHGNLVARTEYARLDSKFNYLLTQPQTKTEEILRQRVLEYGISIEWNTELVSFTQDDEGINAELRKTDGTTEQVRVRYLVGCDGAHSAVRHGTSIPFDGAQYKDAWMLGDVVMDWCYPRDETSIFLDEDGYFAAFPMPDGRSRIFVVREKETLLPDEVTIEELTKAAEKWTHCKVKISDPRWMTKFRVHHRKVRHYNEGRAFLAGDAAHIHSPETGLGMNTGIQDAYNLGWKLSRVCQGQVKPIVLDSYDTERNMVGKEVVQASNAIHVISAQFGPRMSKLRERIFRLANAVYHIHFSSVQKQVQLMIRYKEGSLIEGHKSSIRSFLHRDTLTPGSRAVDAAIYDVQKEKWTRIAEVTSSHMGDLLIFSGMSPDKKAIEYVREACKVSHEYRDIFNTSIIVGCDDVESFHDCYCQGLYKDVSLTAHERYGVQTPCLFHIRPDGYIGLLASHASLKALKGYYSKYVYDDRNRDG